MSSPVPPSRLTQRVRIPKAVVESARAVAFWLAIGLPTLYVPLLWSGLSSDRVALFLGLVALNVLALVVGHGYKA